MKLPFRQGIVKYTVDNNKTPTFLYTDNRSNYISLTAKINNVLIAFAHNDVNYLYEETTNIANAWGPFANNIKYWMYWDIDVKTGFRSFGSTAIEPVIGSTPPAVKKISEYGNAALIDIDTHWFDLTRTGMYVWDGEHWINKIRLFAGTYHNMAITTYALSSQVGIFNDCDAGFIIFNDNNTPRHRARDDGTYKFLTSDTPFYESGLMTDSVSLQPIIKFNKATEIIPRYSLVALTTNSNIKLASWDDTEYNAAIGITQLNLGVNETGLVYNHIYVKNPAWNWVGLLNEPIYLGLDGQISTTPPVTGFTQRVGTIVSLDTVYIDTTFQVVYNDVALGSSVVPLSFDTINGKLYTSFINDTHQSSFISYLVYGNSYRQRKPNNVWILVHDSKLPNFLVQVYDDMGAVILPENIQHTTKIISITDNNTIPKINRDVPASHTIVITFSKKVSGIAQLFLF
jgi:hypothetical protein